MLFQQALRTLLPQHYLRTPSLSSPTSVPNLALVSQFMPAQKPYLPNLLLSSPYLNLDRSKHLEPTYTMHLIAKLSTHSLLITLPTATTFIPVATHNFVAFLLLQTKFLSLDLVFDKVLIQLLAHLLSCLCLWSCFWSYLSVYPCACLDFLPQFPSHLEHQVQVRSRAFPSVSFCFLPTVIQALSLRLLESQSLASITIWIPSSWSVLSQGFQLFHCVSLKFLSCST